MQQCIRLCFSDHVRNFKKFNLNNMDMPYDYGSIKHFGKHAVYLVTTTDCTCCIALNVFLISFKSVLGHMLLFNIIIIIMKH